MTQRQKLSEGELLARLTKLDGWELDEAGRLYRRFDLPDFVSAFGFIAELALVAESMDHHPEWTNIYRTVEVRLITHTVGAVTELDIELAARIDRVWQRRRLEH